METIVGFVGYECEDIVIYLARIIGALGKKVAVVDKTEQEMLVEMLELEQCPENRGREGEYCGIWVTNQGVSKDEFDVIICMFGYRLVHPKLYECETVIMVTDGLPAHASLLKNMEHWECRQYLMIRNLVPMKHTEKYLAMLAEEENYGEIPYDEQDIRMRCSLGSYADCKLKKLSAGLKKALTEVVCFLSTEYRERDVWEVMRKM